MKKPNTIIVSLLAFAISGCGVIQEKTGLTPFDQGVIAGTGSQVVFQNENEEKKFQEVKKDIEDFLASGETLTQKIINNYIKDLQEDFSPAFFDIITRRLELELKRISSYAGVEFSEADVREFIAGFAASIQEKELD